MTTRPIPDYVREYFGSHDDMRITAVFVGSEGWCPTQTTEWSPVGDIHHDGCPATWDVFEHFHAQGIQDFEVTGTRDVDGYDRTAVADFRYHEIVKHAMRPMFGGRVI